MYVHLKQDTKRGKNASYTLSAFLQPETKLGQGNIFRSVCQEFCSHLGAVHARRYGQQAGQYASYWNAYLSLMNRYQEIYLHVYRWTRSVRSWATVSWCLQWYTDIRHGLLPSHLHCWECHGSHTSRARIRCLPGRPFPVWSWPVQWQKFINRHSWFRRARPCGAQDQTTPSAFVASEIYVISPR